MDIPLSRSGRGLRRHDLQSGCGRVRFFELILEDQSFELLVCSIDHPGIVEIEHGAVRQCGVELVIDVLKLVFRCVW